MTQAVLCWFCGRNIDPLDSYCRWCGRGQGEHVPWYYSPVAIALLTVFALGPFSLPLVWRSPKLSENGRWIATILVLLYTAYLAYATLQAVRVLVSPTSPAVM